MRLTNHSHTAVSSARHRRMLNEQQRQHAEAAGSFLAQLVAFFLTGGMLGFLINLVFGV